MTPVVFSPAVANRLVELNVYNDIHHIHCALCGADTLPPTKVSEAAVCQHDTEVINEAEYHLEFGADVCDDCSAVLLPALQDPHKCGAASTQ